MQAYGGDPLEDYFQGRITLRKLRVMIQGLPPDSPLGRAHNGSYWLDAEYLLRDTAMSFRTFLAMFWKANFQGNPPKVDVIPVPSTGESVQSRAEAEYEAQHRVEMDALMLRIDPNK